VDYYSPPSLFPYALPAILGLTALGYAHCGWGRYGTMFRELIVKYGGEWLLPLSTGFAGVMVGPPQLHPYSSGMACMS